MTKIVSKLCVMLFVNIISLLLTANFSTLGIEDAHVHQNMASCVLGVPKPFGRTKTTCPIRGKITPKSLFFFMELNHKIYVMATENKQYNKGGRPPKIDPCRHRYSFKLNDVDNAHFLSMFDKTGWTDKSKFIKTCLFKREIKYVKLDKAAMDYYMRLTTFHSQFRAIGANYNQIVKHLKASFSEKTALTLLYKLEKATIELVTIQRQVVKLTEELEKKYLLKQ